MKRLLIVATPLSLGMMSQNVMSVIDSIMIADLGLAALAAIGMGSFVILIFNASTVGFATFVQREMAIALGAGRQSEGTTPLLSALFVALISLPLFSLLIFFIIPDILPYMHEDEAVVHQMIPYVETRVWALVFIAMNFAFRGYYSALHLTSIYLIFMLIMQLINVFFNYLFIEGNLGAPALGVQGAALASMLATFCGVLLNVWYFILPGRGKLYAPVANVFAQVKQIWKIVVPYGLQQMAMIGGIAMMLWIVGLSGTENLAIAGLVLNVSAFFFLPAIGFGIAIAGEMSRELGAKSFQALCQWVSLGSKLVVIIFFLLALPLMLFTQPFLNLFFENVNIVEQASPVLRLAALFFCIDALALVMLQVLYVVKQGFKALVINTLLQWGVLLPSLYVAVTEWQLDLLSIWIMLIVIRLTNAVLLIAIWRPVRASMLRKI